MDAERRKQDIATLREMQGLLGSIGDLQSEMNALCKEIKNCGVKHSDYATHNEEETEVAKKEETDQEVERWLKTEKAAKAKFKWIFWVALAAGVAVIALLKNIWAGILVAVAGYILPKILEAPAVKRCRKEHSEERTAIEKKYEKLLEEARKKDEDEEARYDADCEAERAKKEAEAAPRKSALQSEIDAKKSRYDEISIVSKKDLDRDPDIIEKLLDLMEGSRADSVKEALLELDREKRRQEEARLAAIAAERARQAAEQARLAAMPGKVTIRIGSINTYSGALQAVRNTIYVDGAPYGSGSPSPAVIQLNPGPHAIYAQLQEAGYIFTTPTHSFNLQGNGNVYLKIMIKNARAAIYPCSTEQELLSDR